MIYGIYIYKLICHITIGHLVIPIIYLNNRCCEVRKFDG